MDLSIPATYLAPSCLRSERSLHLGSAAKEIEIHMPREEEGGKRGGVEMEPIRR